MSERVDVSRVGVWSSAIRANDVGEAREAAAELEELGFGAIWIPGRTDDVFERAEALLAATRRIAIGTGIVSIWNATPEEARAAHLRLRTEHPGRFLLGLGVSHAPVVDQDEPGRYRKPLALMRDYLDGLDEEPAVPRGQRVLAALAPKMLELARERAAGSHTYLVPVEHTRFARGGLGSALLAPELGVVLESDAERARGIARRHLALYLPLPNYVSAWIRGGLTEADVADVSDRLVDALVGWGDAEQVAARVRAHHEAGADHVAVQVLAEDTQTFHREAWRRLADVLVRP